MLGSPGLASSSSSQTRVTPKALTSTVVASPSGLASQSPAPPSLGASGGSETWSFVPSISSPTEVQKGRTAPGTPSSRGASPRSGGSAKRKLPVGGSEPPSATLQPKRLCSSLREHSLREGEVLSCEHGGNNKPSEDEESRLDGDRPSSPPMHMSDDPPVNVADVGQTDGDCSPDSQTPSALESHLRHGEATANKPATALPLHAFFSSVVKPHREISSLSLINQPSQLRPSTAVDAGSQRNSPVDISSNEESSDGSSSDDDANSKQASTGSPLDPRREPRPGGQQTGPRLSSSQEEAQRAHYGGDTPMPDVDVEAQQGFEPELEEPRPSIVPDSPSLQDRGQRGARREPVASTWHNGSQGSYFETLSGRSTPSAGRLGRSRRPQRDDLRGLPAPAPARGAGEEVDYQKAILDILTGGAPSRKCECVDGKGLFLYIPQPHAAC
jgi:hypothetical protein